MYKTQGGFKVMKMLKHKKSGEVLKVIAEQGATLIALDKDENQKLITLIIKNRWYEEYEIPDEVKEEDKPIPSPEGPKSACDKSKDEKVIDTKSKDEKALEDENKPKEDDKPKGTVKDLKEGANLQNLKIVPARPIQEITKDEIILKAPIVLEQFENVKFYDFMKKDYLYTEAKVTTNGHDFSLGTVYAQNPKTGKYHPSSSYYHIDNKITDPLRPIQRKGVKTASEMLQSLMAMDVFKIASIIEASRTLSIYDVKKVDEVKEEITEDTNQLKEA